MLEEALSKLSPNLRGSVITPVSGEYEAARKVYNGMMTVVPTLSFAARMWRTRGLR
jgi:hypothetical protein